MIPAESKNVKGTAYIYISVKTGVLDGISYVYLCCMVVDDFGAELAKRLFKSGGIPYVALNKLGFRRDVVLRSR